METLLDIWEFLLKIQWWITGVFILLSVVSFFMTMRLCKARLESVRRRQELEEKIRAMGVDPGIMKGGF